MRRLHPRFLALLVAGFVPTVALAQAKDPATPASPGQTAEPKGSCTFTRGADRKICVNNQTQGACHSTGMESGSTPVWQAGQTCP